MRNPVPVLTVFKLCHPVLSQSRLVSSSSSPVLTQSPYSPSLVLTQSQPSLSPSPHSVQTTFPQSQSSPTPRTHPVCVLDHHKVWILFVAVSQERRHGRVSGHQAVQFSLARELRLQHRLPCLQLLHHDDGGVGLGAGAALSVPAVLHARQVYLPKVAVTWGPGDGDQVWSKSP